MDAIEALKLQARQKRDAEIAEVRAEYRETMRYLSVMRARLKKQTVAPPQKSAEDKPYAGFSTIQAAELVLLEGKPLRLTELALAIMERGCRSNDNPRRVAHAVRNALRYHSGRFRQGRDRRWGTVARRMKKPRAGAWISR